MGEEELLDLVLGGLVDVLLVESNKGLGDGLADSVHLRGETTTLHADADIDLREARLAEKVDGLHALGAEELRLEKAQGLAIDLDEALAALADGNGDRGLLLTEDLNRVLWRRLHFCFDE